MRVSRRESLPKLLLACLVVALAAGAIGGGLSSTLAGCGGSEVTTTTAVAVPSTTSSLVAGSDTTATPSSDMTSTTSSGSTTETTAETIVEPPSKPAAELFHYWWGASSDPGGWQSENISALVAEGADNSRIVGDAYRYSDPNGTFRDSIFATGEDGDLLVFWNGLDIEKWSLTPVPSPTGRPLRELLGGRAHNSPLAVTGTGTGKSLHVFATDTADNLIHFSLEPGGSWQSENVTEATGVSVARVGSARAATDGDTLEVCGLNPDDELLYFRLAAGGSWSAENPSKLTGRVAKKEATFLTDPLGVSDTTIASSCLMDDLLLYHRAADGTWMLEDITQETTSDTADPGVSLGGWLSWWDWQSADFWDPSQFTHPLAILTTLGHFQLLERKSMDSPWRITDVSQLTGVIFAADGGGSSIIRLCPPLGASAKEAHFAGVDKQRHLIHFWRDAKGKWHSEDYTATSSQKFAYPLDCFASPSSDTAAAGAGSTHRPFFLGITPVGQVGELSSPEIGGYWQETGYELRGPALTWGESGTSDLVLAGGT